MSATGRPVNEVQGAEPDLSVRLGPLHLPHPLLNASGTFDALEIARRFGPDALRPFPFAAYVPKTVTLEARAGNLPPRVTETASGMVNAIGLENPGIDEFLETLPEVAQVVTVPLIVNVGGSTADDYVEVVRRVEAALADGRPDLPDVVGFELNVSCPNVGGGLAIGTDETETARLVERVRTLSERFLVVKLTPNVADIAAVARAAAAAGADCVSLVNTFKALVLEPSTLEPFLGNHTGGLCGPAIKPIALRMVWEVAAAVEVPIIGMGGIVSGLDVLEFVACGATAVAVGAANFLGPDVPQHILGDVRRELLGRGMARLSEIRGRALGSVPSPTTETR